MGVFSPPVPMESPGIYIMSIIWISSRYQKVKGARVIKKQMMMAAPPDDNDAATLSLSLPNNLYHRRKDRFFTMSTFLSLPRLQRRKYQESTSLTRCFYLLLCIWITTESFKTFLVLILLRPTYISFHLSLRSSTPLTSLYASRRVSKKKKGKRGKVLLTLFFGGYFSSHQIFF